MKLSAVQKQFLVDATSRYHESLPGSPADEHLASRGFESESLRERLGRFRLGYVADPLPGHERYKGMMAIPYLRRGENREWTVVSMRFRCLEDHDHQGHGKYMTPPGDRARLFNTVALLGPEEVMMITEGEIDAVTSTCYGFPAVAVPGASNWKRHFREPFLGYETVFILADGDTAGLKFADVVKEDLPNARIIPAPDGEDVNSWITTKDGFNDFKGRVTQ